MDDIAKEAGYSKATLYVYFKNKDEIISCMTLVAMNMLLDIVKTCTTTHKDFKSQYFALCYAITDFQKEHLFYYESIFKEINVDIEPVSYTHLRAHETVLDLVCRLLLEKKKKKRIKHKTDT